MISADSTALKRKEYDDIRRVVPDITCNQIHESRKFYMGFLGFDVAMDTDELWSVRRFFVTDPNGVVINVMNHQNDVG